MNSTRIEAFIDATKDDTLREQLYTAAGAVGEIISRYILALERQGIAPDTITNIASFISASMLGALLHAASAPTPATRKEAIDKYQQEFLENLDSGDMYKA